MRVDYVPIAGRSPVIEVTYTRRSICDNPDHFVLHEDVPFGKVYRVLVRSVCRMRYGCGACRVMFPADVVLTEQDDGSYNYLPIGIFSEQDVAKLLRTQ